MAGGYWEKMVECGNGFTFVTKYSGGTQTVGGKRAKKSKPTSEQKKRYNIQKSIERLFYILLCNFLPGDYHLVFTYPRGTVQSIAEAKNKFSKFLDLYRQHCKAHGRECKYVYNTEIGGNGALHHHCILRRYKDIEDIEEMWLAAGGGKIQSRSSLWPNYDWYGLAEYFVDKTKGGKLPDTHIPGERRYVPSKGLRKPIVKVRRVESKRWYKPKAKKGYEILPDSIRGGTDELTGGNYIKYTMRRLI